MDQQSASPSSDERTLLASYLRDRDVPCPGCGYNLRGITTDRCPECSRAIALHVMGASTPLESTRRLSLWAIWILLAGFVWRLGFQVYFAINTYSRILPALPPVQQAFLISSQVSGFIVACVCITLLGRGLRRRSHAQDSDRGKAVLFSIRMLMWSVLIEIIEKAVLYTWQVLTF